jgi:hypothetical protein
MARLSGMESTNRRESITISGVDGIPRVIELPEFLDQINKDPKGMYKILSNRVSELLE